MTIFKYEDEEALGAVLSVDTATVIIKVADLDRFVECRLTGLLSCKVVKQDSI